MSIDTKEERGKLVKAALTDELIIDPREFLMEYQTYKKRDKHNTHECKAITCKEGK